MRNISELIGIIKGIDFDGVINNKEIDILKSWINQNRNLVCDAIEANFISLIDHIIADGIITDKERAEMIAQCDNFLIMSSDDFTMVYELNGIVEGIICDGEVNEAEVHRLKEWMYKNGEYVRMQKKSAMLCKVIDDVLADGIVTEEERLLLLAHIELQIKEIRFETKLINLKKQVKARNNIGIDLIDLLDNHEAINEIHQRAELQLKTALNSYSGQYLYDQEIVFISLVLIGLLHYDGNYYDYVRSTYKKTYQLFNQQKIEGLIRTILNRYRSNPYEKKGRERIINVVLSNAIVPSHFLKSFFEFIYDIYKHNFEYNLSDDLYGDFKFVYEGLRASMVSDSDDLQVNVTRKSYKLIKATKQLIMDSELIDSVIKLSIIVVKLIDKHVWNKDVKIYSLYLKNGFEGWVSTLEKNTGTIIKKGTAALRSRWEPKYLLQNNKIYIVPPIHRIKACYNYFDIKVIVKNNDKTIYVNSSPDIREIIGGYEVNIDKIPVEQPLGKITYFLTTKNDSIYDSKDKLHRSFIFFDSNGNEIKNNTDYTGTATLCAEKLNENFASYFQSLEYTLSSKNVRIGETYIIDNAIFNFSSLVKPGLIGELHRNCYVVATISNAKIPVYKNIKYLTFECNNYISKFNIVIDGREKSLTEFIFSVAKREGINKYVINFDILKSGFHHVEVYSDKDSQKERILNLKFVIDTNLSYQSNKINDEVYFLSARSDLIPCSINEEMNANYFREDWIRFSYSGVEYAYFIPFDINFYRIDNSSWTSTCQDIWIEDINQDSVLEIYGCDLDEIQIMSNTGKILEEPISLKEQLCSQQLRIGFLTTYKTSYDYIVLMCIKDGKAVNAIFCYNKCILNLKETELEFDPVRNCLDVKPCFYGKGDVYISVTCDTEKMYTSAIVKNGDKDRIFNLPPLKKLEIAIIERSKGVLLKKERVLHTYEQTLYPYNSYIGRTFKISEIYYDQFIHNRFKRKMEFFNNTYITFVKRISNDTFIGKIKVKTRTGEYYLNRINPVKIEFCGDIIDGTVELSITKDGDGLLLDSVHNGIMNNIDDDSAVDIFSYIIEMNEVTSFE